MCEVTIGLLKLIKKCDSMAQHTEANTRDEKGKKKTNIENSCRTYRMVVQVV